MDQKNIDDMIISNNRKKNILNLLNKYHNYIIGISFALLIIILIIALITRDKVQPIVYVGNDDLVYLYDGKDISEITSKDQVDNIKYSSNHDVLYLKDKNLYLNNELILEKSINYMFNSNETFVITLSNERNLYGYDIKNDKLIEYDEDITSIVFNNDDYVGYIKDNEFKIKKINSDEEYIKIDDFNNSSISKSKSVSNYLYYINTDSTLIKINLNNKDIEDITENVNEIYVDDLSDNIYILVNDNSLYYYDGKVNIIGFNITNVIAYDSKNNLIIYNKDESTYYAYKNSEKIVCDEIVNYALIDNDKVYYSIDNNLKYFKLKDGIIIEEKELNENVVLSSLIKYKNGLVYLMLDDGNKKIYYFNGDSNKYIDQNIYLIDSDVHDNKIYYMKDFEDKNGKLVTFNGKKYKIIKKDIYDFSYLNKNSLYLIKYENKKYNLYLDGFSEKKIVGDIKSIKK